jgi:hypothetical protein
MDHIEEYTEYCANCGLDQSGVDFADIIKCDKCEQIICKDCAILKPIKFSIIDEIVCKKCLSR